MKNVFTKNCFLGNFILLSLLLHSTVFGQDVLFNQVGYRASDHKDFRLNGDANTFQRQDRNGTDVYSGTISGPIYDNDAEEDVWKEDFTNFPDVQLDDLSAAAMPLPETNGANFDFDAPHFVQTTFAVASGPATVDVTTRAMLGSGDRADDPAVWIHPSNKSASIILGVNKSSDGVNGGIYAFDLDGTSALDNSQWKEGVNLFEKGERYNNVDIRYKFPAGGEAWDIVCASNRSDREIDVFRVKKNSSGNFTGLEIVGEIPLGSGFARGSDAPYGLGMFHHQSTGNYYVLTSDKEGKVAQYKLQYNPRGSGDSQITGTRVAGVFDVSGNGSEVEGIVADDERGIVYIAAEDRGIYRYATNGSGTLTGTRVTVATVSGNNALKADLEGLTMYYQPDGEGYLIASVQGSNEYAVFERAYTGNNANKYLRNFSIQGVEKTDGLDVTNVDLGGKFTSGMLVVHDGVGESPTRYKLVSWDEVADSGSPRLAIDTSCDPREGCGSDGGGGTSQPLSGSYQFKNVDYNQWLDGDSDGDVDLNTNPGSDKVWELESVSEGVYRLRNQRFGGWLDGDSDGDVDLDENRKELDRQWQVEEVRTGVYRLKNQEHGQWLTGTSGGDVVLGVGTGANSEWEAVRVDNARQAQNSKNSPINEATTAELHWNMYPNPASKQLTIEAANNGDYQVDLYDVGGRHVMQHRDKGNTEIDISHLHPGVYLIKLSKGALPQIQQRVIVE